MAHHKSAIKRIRQSKRRNFYNRRNKKAMKLAIRAVKESKSYEEGMDKLKSATSVLDRVAARGIVHKNFAANKKSKLSKLVLKLKSK
jgi:small subunit ribosomal protein S20